MFLLKLNCLPRKLLLFKWNQSCFSFLALTMFSGPVREVDILLALHWVSKHNNLFLPQTPCSSEAHTVRLYHPLRPLLALSISLLSSSPFRVLAVIHSPTTSLSFVSSHLSSFLALSSKDLIIHENMIVARVNVYGELSECQAHCSKCFMYLTFN